MSETPGQNTIAGEQLKTFVERLENLQSQKDAIGEDMKVVMQEAKATGFNANAIRHVLRVRKMKPHDWQEEQSVFQVYRHAMGLDADTPAFRALENMDVDVTVGEKVIEALKRFVPQKGELIINVGRTKKRLYRDHEGNPQVADWHEDAAAQAKRPQAGAPAPGPKRDDIPEVDEDEAEEMGKRAAKRNEPIISNPFPYGDTRRARFDKGWCAAAGSDGMGPQEEEREADPADAADHGDVNENENEEEDSGADESDGDDLELPPELDRRPSAKKTKATEPPRTTPFPKPEPQDDEGEEIE